MAQGRGAEGEGAEANSRADKRLKALTVGAAICALLTVVVLAWKAVESSGDMAATVQVTTVILAINAIGAIFSVAAFEMLVGSRMLLTKGYLALPLLAPVLIFAFEMLRPRDYSYDAKTDHFESFRASVMVSAALAASASLPPAVSKMVVCACLIVAAAVLPLSTASNDSPTGAIAQAAQRSLMLLLIWGIAAVVLARQGPLLGKKNA